MHDDIVFGCLFGDLDNLFLREDGSRQGILKANQTSWCSVYVGAELEIGQDVILQSQVMTCCGRAKGASIRERSAMCGSRFMIEDLPFLGASACVVACEKSAIPPASDAREVKMYKVQRNASL